MSKTIQLKIHFTQDEQMKCKSAQLQKAKTVQLKFHEIYFMPIYHTAQQDGKGLENVQDGRIKIPSIFCQLQCKGTHDPCTFN